MLRKDLPSGTKFSYADGASVAAGTDPYWIATSFSLDTPINGGYGMPASPQLEVVVRGPLPGVVAAVVSEDPVNPSHYRNLKPEPIDVIRAWGLDKDHFRATALTYIVRAGVKGGPEKYAEDLKKAIQYLQWATEKPQSP